MKLRALTSIVALTALAAALPGHGGQYRGNPDAPAGPGAAPPTPDSRTGGRPVSPTSVMWETWWEFNKDAFVRTRSVGDDKLPITGGDDFFLGAGRPGAKVDLLRPTEADLRDLVVPALIGILQRERNRDIASACLIALGKIGLDPPAHDLEALLAAQIRRDDQEVRESAVLALGIAGRPQALPLLLALARDSAEGRRLLDRLEDVGNRTRAFAAFGLGLLARRVGEVDLVQQVADVCLALAEDRDLDRELRVAALSSLGILAVPGDARHKRLAWNVVDRLAQLFASKVGPAEEMTLSHAPVAIARLLGRGTSAMHRRGKDLFAAELTARSPRGSPILRAAVIALGAMAVPAEQDGEDARYSQVLRQTAEKAVDQHARLFALIALGRIGGAGNRAFLLRAYERGNRHTEKPWAAIALGLATFAAGSRGEVDVEVAERLLADLPGCAEDSLRGALGVALGLVGHDAAAPEVLRVLLDNEREQLSAGYLCIGLGLLGDRAVIPELVQVLDRSVRRPFLLQNCAIGLGMLGDRDAAQRLVAKMNESDSAAVLASLATALGRIGDRRSIAALIEILQNDELTKLARAFVAAALGCVGDKDRQPWNLPLSRDCNYASPTGTLSSGGTGVLDIL